MLIQKPSVLLVTRPQILWDEVAAFFIEEGLPDIDKSLIGDHEDAGAMITQLAARLCYGSYGRGRKDIADFIQNLISGGDGSVFEHINYGFMVTGVSRSLTHELVRHRVGIAFSQRSQRYVDESETNFIVPPLLQSNPIAQEFFAEATAKAKQYYDRLVAQLEMNLPQGDEYPGGDTARRKAIRQAARSVLPNATETKIMVTANVRTWRNILEQRGSRYADSEIQRFAFEVHQILQDEAPLLFGDIQRGFVDAHTMELTTPYHKV